MVDGAAGLGETGLSETKGRGGQLKLARSQFTRDLVPSDITGSDLVQEDAATGRRQMVFAPGRMFANIVLGDEINSTPPAPAHPNAKTPKTHFNRVPGTGS